jgi:IS1 family transposase
MSARLHTRLFFRSLVIGHLQLDELYAKVKHGADQVWVWTAIAAKSKLLVAFHVGGRKIEDAQCLLHQVWQRLQPQHLPVFTSDGLNHYFYGLTAHFGQWQKPPRARKYHWFPNARLQYAQLRKRRSGRKVAFLFSIIRLGTRDIIRQALRRLELSGIIQTAFIERSNLTLRHLVAALARRTWSLAHDIYHLWLYINWGFAYYNFVRVHDSLRIRGPSRRRHRTPAMAAGLTCRPWLVRDLLLLPMPEEVWIDSYPV